MKSWGLNFITEDNFKKHVVATIEKYGEKLESFDIKRFNKNININYLRRFIIILLANNFY